MSLQKSTGHSAEAPLHEQQICIRCGMCCDGTLFLHAALYPGERGNLPDMIETNSYTESGMDYFRLPCLYFSGRCTIYKQKKAFVCSGYRCQLLKDLAAETITQDDASEILRSALKMRSEIIERYRDITGDHGRIIFRQILTRLGNMKESQAESKNDKTESDLLLAQCNIFEALLIKHIRSASDFDSMVINSPPEDNNIL